MMNSLPVLCSECGEPLKFTSDRDGLSVENCPRCYDERALLLANEIVEKACVELLNARRETLIKGEIKA